MIENEIEYNGNKYYKFKVFQEEGTTYIEYRNDDIKSIKFFEEIDGKICEIKDLEKLKKVIEKNYHIKTDYIV